MIGTFTTSQYADRRAYERADPYAVLVSKNLFTDAGLEWFWRMALGRLRDTEGGLNDELQSARIVVGNGERAFAGTDVSLAGELTHEAGMQPEYPEILGMRTDDTGVPAFGVRFCAVFGERDAIFDWRERGVVTAQGVLIDRSVGDQGRKVLGTVWKVEAELEITR